MLRILVFMSFVGVCCLKTTANAGEKSLYDFLWLDPDKSVYVLQNKIYEKQNSAYFDLGYVSNITSAYQNTDGLAFKGGYYFHEEWAIEALYIGYKNANNENYKNVQLLNSGVPFVRKPRSTYGVGILWSPFYGKINTFNSIYYFDWSFGAGYARVQTLSNLSSVTSSSGSDSYERENYNGAYMKSGVKFHMNKNWHVGMEWMGTYYRAPGPKNPSARQMKSNNDLIFSVGWSY